jgi:hypothetical protein
MVSFFTSYKCQGQVFRAHLNYRQAIGPWSDWVLFRWRKEQCRGCHNWTAHFVDIAHMKQDFEHEEYDYAPTKLLGFVEIGNNIVSRIFCWFVVTYQKSSVFTTQWKLAFWDCQQCNPMIKLFLSVDATVRYCLMIPQDGPSSIVYHEV